MGPALDEIGQMIDFARPRPAHRRYEFRMAREEAAEERSVWQRAVRIGTYVCVACLPIGSLTGMFVLCGFELPSETVTLILRAALVLVVVLGASGTIWYRGLGQSNYRG